MERNEPEVKRRTRVVRACAVCRKKKVKCDAKVPCSNCVTFKFKCVYDVVKKPPKRKYRVTKSEHISKMYSRLEKVEVLLERISNKILGPVRENGATSSESGEWGQEGSESDESCSRETDDETDDEISDDYLDVSDKTESVNGVEEIVSNHHVPISKMKKKKRKPGSSQMKGISSAFGSKAEKNTSNLAIANGSGRIHRSKLQEYFGSHSLLCVFSDKSTEWLKSKIPADSLRLISPIQRVPKVIENWAYEFAKLWIDPPFMSEKEFKELRVGVFPDYNFVMSLLDSVYDNVFLASFLCDLKSIKELFTIYYRNQGTVSSSEEVEQNEDADGKDPERTKRSLLQSELLIMNASLAFCIASVLDKQAAGFRKEDLPLNLRQVKQSHLYALQETCLRNCIFYYSRVSVVSEGLPTVQGILLLVVYIDMSSLILDVNYVLTSVAVRLAQSIGLHRFESFRDDPEETADLKRTVWWFCQYLDMEVCYKSGKPPIINNNDVTTLTEEDLQSKISPFVYLGNESQTAHGDSKEANCLDEKDSNEIALAKGFHSYTCYVLMQLTGIRAKGYSQLFSANVQDYSIQNLVSTLKDFNTDMFNLSESIHSKLKPRLHTDPHFNDVPFESLFEMQSVGDCGAENYLSIQFSFFLNLMTINRIPFLVESGEDDQPISGEFLPFRNLALDSARTILKISSRLNPSTTPLSFANWSVFAPFTAFLILLGNCLNHQTTPETLEDIDLLTIASLNVFHNKHANYKHNTNRLRDPVIDIIVRIMLRILIVVVESNTGMKILDNNSELKSRLENLETEIPDLYSGKHSNMSFVFEEFKYSGSPQFSQTHSQASPSEWKTASSKSTISDMQQHNQLQSRVSQSHIMPSGSSISNLRDNMIPKTLPQSKNGPCNSRTAIAVPREARLNGSGELTEVNSNSTINTNSLSPGILSMVFPTEGDVESFSTIMNTLPNYFFDNNLGI